MKWPFTAKLAPNFCSRASSGTSRPGASREVLRRPLPRAGSMRGPHRVAVHDGVLDHEVVARAQPRHPGAQLAQHVVARMVGIEDEEERSRIRAQQCEGLVHDRRAPRCRLSGSGCAHATAIAATASRHRWRPPVPGLPRATSVSAKNSAEPPWRVPVSITCSMRRLEEDLLVVPDVARELERADAVPRHPLPHVVSWNHFTYASPAGAIALLI